MMFCRNKNYWLITKFCYPFFVFYHFITWENSELVSLISTRITQKKKKTPQSLPKTATLLTRCYWRLFRVFTIYLRKFLFQVIIDAPCHAMNVIIVIVEIISFRFATRKCVHFFPHKKYSFFSIYTEPYCYVFPCFIHLSGGTLTKLSFWAIFFLALSVLLSARTAT